MPISSAHELRDLIQTLSGQFAQQHAPTAQRLWQDVDQHLRHVSEEAGSWIEREIESLVQEWEDHKRAVRAAEQWFEHHTSLLARMAQDPEKLASESFAGNVSSGPAHAPNPFRSNWRDLLEGVGAAGGVLGFPGVISTYSGWSRVSKLGFLAKSGPLKALGAAGAVISTSVDTTKAADSFHRGDVVGGVSNTLRTFGDVLKGAGGEKPSLNPIYGAGFLASEYADVVDAGNKFFHEVHWSEGIPLPTPRNIVDDYIPTAKEVGKDLATMVWKWF